MDIEKFVQDIKSMIDEKGVSYARAGRESGAGEEFIRNMERKKSAPSIDRVQMMANYLDVTVSDLLGETKADVPEDIGLSDAEQMLIDQFRLLTDEQKDMVIRMVQAASDSQQ